MPVPTLFLPSKRKSSLLTLSFTSVPSSLTSTLDHSPSTLIQRLSSNSTLLPPLLGTLPTLPPISGPFCLFSGLPLRSSVGVSNLRARVSSKRLRIRASTALSCPILRVMKSSTSGCGLELASGSRTLVRNPPPALGTISYLFETDIILTETGTSSFGLTNVVLPSNSTYIAQILWGAIGWSVGACLGAAMAAKENGNNRRVVLFVGDGSLQLVSPL